MNPAVLTFTTEGDTRCLYTEIIDLTSLGSLQITRATTIEFNHTTQSWEVSQDGTVIFQHRSRALCLAWEQQHFNH